MTDKNPDACYLRLYAAAQDLLADIRSRYPGQTFRCPYLVALDDAVAVLTKIQEET